MTTAAKDHQNKSNANTAIIRMPELEIITGLARPTVYKRLKDDPTFPRPVSLSDSKSKGRPVGWVLSEVQDWVRSRIDKREAPSAEIKNREPESRHEDIRDRFAMAALQGILANAHLSRSIMKEPAADRRSAKDIQSWHAEAAFQFADAMMESRK
tara:strand:+ start:680 stop:1144 length:465 start_codon:yes stop_codon:yes gene_type:complete